MNHKNYLLLIFFLLINNTAIYAEDTSDKTKEKPLVIKGLSIGMNGDDARTIMEKIVGPDWILTKTGPAQKVCEDYKDGDYEIFETKPLTNDTSPSLFSKPILYGKYGFAIKNSKDFYVGFIFIDEKTNKVIRIAFGGKLTDYIFNSSNVYADEFVEQFRVNYNMPDFYWILHGWQHKSIYGYTVQITTSKRIDIQLTGKVNFD
jgi:hypothetical protein